MKVRIAYLPEEEQRAERLQAAVSAILENARPHRREKHPPIRHIYFSERKTAKNADTIAVAASSGGSIESEKT